MTTRPVAPERAGIDGAQAWARSLAEPHAVWDPPPSAEHFAASVRGRLAAGPAVPYVVPKFALRADDVFFCIGSCFARVIELELMLRDLAVSSLSLRAELLEVPNAPNGFVNKFTTASMLNELHWSLGGRPFPEEALIPDGDGYRDLQLAEARTPVTLQRARERRRDVLEYFGRLREATVVFVTLGLVEVWYDHVTELYLNSAPTYEMVLRFPGRFTMHSGDYRENRERLDEICDMLEREGPAGVRVVLTVSPVPMHRTFTAADVLAANVYGKSTLRAVAEDVARARPNVEYFPAYELVTVSDRRFAFNDDQLHVSRAMGGVVVASFLSSFGLDAQRTYPEYDEHPYLRANPDVKATVVRGDFGTGYEHWLRVGRAEGRPLTP
ncbi:MAG: GSCFA domain-containing protein [Candidatus Eremiobacteraeota bacterium]|nr:GSCFA domain-containing protein [Candidatus Eremiobacteraeota bacterium]